MDIKYINPFLEALKNVLETFGASDIKKGGLQKKETMLADMDITSIIGIVGDVRGNIAYCMTEETGKKIASAMMMGMPVETLDSIARSALGEMANMMGGRASAILSQAGVATDLTPPSIIIGRDIMLIISSVQTVAVDMETPFGRIQINIGLEV
ncbi:MAG: chemotaxis protein CheX [Clostridia bacterium]|nr:chemotaxis protein CheX [Clostridia bacterium]